MESEERREGREGNYTGVWGNSNLKMAQHARYV